MRYTKKLWKRKSCDLWGSGDVHGTIGRCPKSKNGDEQQTFPRKLSVVAQHYPLVGWKVGLNKNP